MALSHVFAIDPGTVNNGFAYFKYDTDTKKADLKVMQVLSSKGLSDMLKVIWGIRQKNKEANFIFVVENFRVDQYVRNKVFQWDEVLTVRNIGKVELCAEWVEAKMVIQEPAILGMARKWAPFPLPKGKGHIPDDKSAFLHGANYMMDMKWIRTPDQITFFGQEKL